MINNKIKRLKLFVTLASAAIRFTSAVTLEQPEVVPLYIG